MFARLLDGESAYAELACTLARHINSNLWAVHPPFQIDANFGYAAAVNEMLAQSHLLLPEGPCEERVRLLHLLPALPCAWADGRARGMRVRGGFEVDILWQAGQLTELEIKNVCGSAEKIRLRCGEGELTLELAPGGSRRFDKREVRQFLSNTTGTGAQNEQ